MNFCQHNIAIIFMPVLPHPILTTYVAFFRVLNNKMHIIKELVTFDLNPASHGINHRWAQIRLLLIR